MKNSNHPAQFRRAAQPSSRFLALSVLICQGLFNPAQAQQQLPSLDAGQLLKQEQNKPAPAFQEQEGPLLTAPRRSPAGQEAASTDEGKVLIKQIEFMGASSQMEGAILELTRSRLNQSLSFSEIQLLAEEVSTFYRKQGYFLAHVLVPVQDISGGKLTLQVIEGRLSQGSTGVTVAGSQRSSAQRIENTLRASLDSEAGLNEYELERGILLLNDLPGIKATVMVEPGQEAQTSRLVATVKEGSRIRGAVSLDNAGNRYTGAFRSGLSLYADNLTGEGDQLAAQYSKSVNGDFSYGRLAYSRPVGYSGLILGVSASSVDYASGKELESLDAQGNARSFALNAQYPLIRSRATNLFLSTSLENRLVRSQTLGIAVTDKRFDAVSVGINGDYSDSFMGSGISSAGLLLTHGRLDLDRLPGALAADQGINGPRTQGDYERLNFNATRLQSLTQSTVAQVSLNGQYATQNMDSGEKIALGGPLGIKAYPAGEALGDRGLVLSMEVRTVLAKAVRFAGVQVGDIQLSAFHDVGRVSQFDQAPATLSTPKTYLLRDIGVGLNMGSAGVYDLRVYLAHALGDNPGADINGKDSNGRSSKTRLGVFTTIYF